VAHNDDGEAATVCDAGLCFGVLRLGHVFANEPAHGILERGVLVRDEVFYPDELACEVPEEDLQTESGIARTWGEVVVVVA